MQAETDTDPHGGELYGSNLKASKRMLHLIGACVVLYVLFHVVVALWDVFATLLLLAGIALIGLVAVAGLFAIFH